ncbi:MAG TPA: hypothetical protein PKE45_08020, partial [Caldilineaceae bacterium]|nr:hypothetical protein [Caldilineaceae bacterium]
MNKMRIDRRLRFVVCLFLTLVGFTPAAPAVADAPPAISGTDRSAAVAATNDANPISDPVWMLWGAGHYAAVEGNGSFYLGGVGRVREWATDLSHFVDYTWLDGLNQQVVLAIAVSPNGDRWFGGDNGLAVLSATGQWTYYTKDNSGLAANVVYGLAIAADGSIWASHGLPAGPISQRAPDGSWHWLPNRTVAVAQHYATILTTLQPTPLWTIRGSEVWVDYTVFDGAGWAQHGEGTPAAMVVDHQATIWALDQSIVHRWNGQSWA